MLAFESNFFPRCQRYRLKHTASHHLDGKEPTLCEQHMFEDEDEIEENHELDCFENDEVEDIPDFDEDIPNELICQS
jgi:hypothetical protein